MSDETEEKLERNKRDTIEEDMTTVSLYNADGELIYAGDLVPQKPTEIADGSKYIPPDKRTP